jgi:hypothetical protein
MHADFETVASADYELVGRTIPGFTMRGTYRLEILPETEPGVTHGRETITKMTFEPHPGSPAKTPQTDPTLTIGSTSEWWRDERGMTRHRDVATGNAAVVSDEDSRDADSMIVFPEEPVGAGAKWREHVELPDRGATVDVELVSHANGRIHTRAQYQATRPFGAMEKVEATVAGGWDADFSDSTPSIVLHRTSTITTSTDKGPMMVHMTLDNTGK